MHTHSHSHSHHHADTSGNEDEVSKRIGWAFFLNFSFTIIEFIGGWLTNSTAIMADAVHDLGDSLSIGTGWVLNKLGRKQANQQYTYGYRRLSLLGALLNAVVLVVGSIWILTEAIPRLFNPVMPHAEGMLLLAIFGVVVNGYAAYKLSAGKTLNEKVLNWHLLEDVLGWVAVLVVSIVLQFVEWPILDPLLSVVFTLFIVFNVVRYLRTTLKLFLQATPDAELSEKIQTTLRAVPGVSDLHHFHLWSLDGESHVLTTHIQVVEGFAVNDYAQLKDNLHEALEDFELSHTTLEIELHDEHCRDH